MDGLELLALRRTLRTLNFKEHSLRTVKYNGEKWFSLRDVAKATGQRNIYCSARKLPKKEIMELDIGVPNNSLVQCVNVSGLYQLLSRSAKPEAAILLEWLLSQEKSLGKEMLEIDTGSRKITSLTREQVESIQSNKCIYDYNGFRIRAVQYDGQPWLAFVDICRALGCTNISREKRKIRPEGIQKLDIGLKNTLAVCINRSGLLDFVLYTQKTEAGAFRMWADKHIFGEASVKRGEILHLIRSLSEDQLTELLLFIRKLRNHHTEEGGKCENMAHRNPQNYKEKPTGSSR